MKITVYANLSAESLLEAGSNAGLSDEAQNYFRFFNEVEMELEVNRETGEVNYATLPAYPLPKPKPKELCEYCDKRHDSSLACPAYRIIAEKERRPE